MRSTPTESDSDNDSDQTLFPKFIMLESTEDTLITSCLPSLLKKTLNSLIKAKSVKKLINNTLLIEVEKNFLWLTTKTKILLQLKN